MSAKGIQKRIDNAHRKVGKALGYVFNLYRPLTNVDVLDDANYIDDIKLTVTLNDSYMSTIGWQTPVWTAYTDAKQLQVGDFLYSEEQGRTFFVMSRQPHLPVLMMEVNDRVDVQVVGYGDDGTGYSPEATTYLARNLPCYISYGASGMGGGVPARSMGTAGIRNATIITTLPREVMTMGATVTNLADTFRGDVVSYDYTSVGRGLRMTVQEFVHAT